MELERKAYQSLLKWKETYHGTRSLLIEGARRVGKTWLVREFGKREYRTCLLINFAQASGEVFKLFEENAYDLDYLYSALSVIYSVQLYERDSLIVFDEVQLCPKARQLTKQMVEDGRYDVICTGSLLSIRKNTEDIVLPSEEKKLQMYPLDFEEFLWAKGNRTLFPMIRKAFEDRVPLGHAVHQAAMKEFRQYLLVGGMPQVVVAYVEKNSFQAADAEKRDILELYREDVSRHAGSNAPRVRAIFDRLPGELAKKEKRFNLASLGKNARSRGYEEAFFWLDDAMITNMCFNATEPTVGLDMNLDDTRVKCYMMDTGLLVTHALDASRDVTEDIYKAILMDRLGINEGMITENYVAQALRTNGHRLFFFTSAREDHSRANEMEIDFLIVEKRKIVPIEVKSSQAVHFASLSKFIARYGKHIGMPVILCRRDIEVKDGILYLPLYMASVM